MDHGPLQPPQRHFLRLLNLIMGSKKSPQIQDKNRCNSGTQGHQTVVLTGEMALFYPSGHCLNVSSSACVNSFQVRRFCVEMELHRWTKDSWFPVPTSTPEPAKVHIFLAKYPQTQ